MELKYIITDKDCFAIFSFTADHIDVAHGLWGTPVGAGRCTIKQEAGDVKVHCYSRSHSLNLESRPEDEGIINHQINGHY